MEHPSPRLCLHELVERQVRKTPKATALVFGNQSLSYAELNARANQLARHLRERGVGPEILVALCMERSLELVIGLLAVLKAGGAYVPLDPEYPASRLAYMLADSAPAVVLSHGPARSILERAAASLASPLTVVDLDEPQWSDQSGDDVELALTDGRVRNLVYVMYTSGSTGRPKGVMNEHGPVVNRMLWMCDRHPLDDRDAVLQKTTICFDISVWEIFWPLISGARLVLAEPRGQQDPDYLAALIVRERITRAHFVPSMLSVFLESRAASSCVCLKDVFCTGEELLRSVAERFGQLLPGARLTNLYGPTEAAIEVTACPWNPTSPAERSVPIGWPIWNAQIHLLDANLAPVPAGTSGVLYIGGLPVARGYRNRPDLTAERFIASPFGVGERLYDTGDLARTLPDGSILFLGRSDDQVKIRGFRVELGEIEARLGRFPGIGATAVLMREDQPGDKRLIAYFTVARETPAGSFSPSALREHVAEALPDYMVPAGFVQLPAMPLTPSGKLDRKALPAPSANAYGATAYEEPVGEREHALAQVWARALGLERVGRSQDFFSLGGDSILAIQVAHRARRQGLKVAPRQLFRFPTVAELAPQVCAGNAEVSAATSSVATTYPATGLQLGLIFHSQTGGARDAYSNQICCELDASFDVAAFKSAWTQLVARHQILRTSFVRMDLEEPLQSVAPQIELTWTERDYESQRQAHRSEPFRFDRAPLMRFLLCHEPEDRWRFAWTYHHCLLDGWSVSIIWSELAQLYRASVSGEDARLPAPGSFEKYVRWLHAQDRAAASAFWKRQLGGLQHASQLSIERASKGERGSSALRWTLSEEDTRALGEASKRHKVTMATLMLAAWAVSIQRGSQSDDVVFGVTTSGRGIDLDGVDAIVGLMINTIPARVIGQSLHDPGVWLRALQAEQAEREANGFLSLAEIQRCSPLGPSTPLFDSVLIFENYAHGAGRSAGFPSCVGMRFEEQTHFGLTLLVVPGSTLWIELSFDTSRFVREDISKMAQELNTLLQTLARTPSEATMSASAAAAANVQPSRMLRQGELRLGRYLVHQLVENEARRSPGKLAVSCAGRELTYDALNRAANRLAHQINARHPQVVAESLVALLMPRNERLLVSILAIWKLGAAYVPIDPQLPSGRVVSMLQGRT